MLNNFFKTLKVNLFFIKNKFSIVADFTNLKVIVNAIYVSLLVYFIINIEEQNFILCSFLVNLFYLISSKNVLVFILFYFLLSVKGLIILYIKEILNFKSSKTKNNVLNNNNLLIVFFYFNFQKKLIWINFMYFLNKLDFWFNSYSYKNTFFYFLISTFFSKNYAWYTIFKKHSIFGYYRISRQRWVELKSEEVNFLKY